MDRALRPVIANVRVPFPVKPADFLFSGSFLSAYLFQIFICSSKYDLLDINITIHIELPSCSISRSLLHSRFECRHATRRLSGGVLRDDAKNGWAADFFFRLLIAYSAVPQ